MIIIRKMNIRDSREVAEIERNSFTSPWSEQFIINELLNPRSTTLVACLDNEIAGFANCWNVLGEIQINNIAVKKKYRRQGIADRLLQTVLENYPNAESFTLEVRISNESAINLYNKYGFERIGERRDFYTLPTENAYIMTKFQGKDEGDGV